MCSDRTASLSRRTDGDAEGLTAAGIKQRDNEAGCELNANAAPRRAASPLTRGDRGVTSPKMHRVTGCVSEKRLLFCRWRDGSLERGRRTGRASTRHLLDKRDRFHVEGTKCFLPRAHGSRQRLKSDQEVKQQKEQVTLWCASLHVCPLGD